MSNFFAHMKFQVYYVVEYCVFLVFRVFLKHERGILDIYVYVVWIMLDAMFDF